jgi:hypothetical protein
MYHKDFAFVFFLFLTCSNFEGLISNFVQLEFFRRYLRAVRAIRPLNFYLAVAEMKRCHTQRRRLEKLEEILQNFFHISQDKSVSFSAIVIGVHWLV